MYALERSTSKYEGKLYSYWT